MHPIVITAYCNTEAKQQMLDTLVAQLWGHYIIVASHTPVSLFVQQRANMVIYDSNNVVDHRLYSHAVADCMLVQQSILILKYYSYTHFHKLCFDTEIHDTEVFRKWESHQNAKFVGAYRDIIGISAAQYFTEIEWFEKHLPLYRDIDTMFKVSNELEQCWMRACNNNFDEMHMYTNEDLMFGPDNKRNLSKQ